MPTINLKEHYPTAHPEDLFVEVSEELYQFFLDMKHKEDAFAKRVSRYHAYHSLDDPSFALEQCTLCLPENPCHVVERWHHLLAINEAIFTLPHKQAQRCYAYYYLGMQMQDIARKEGVTVASISECIKTALTALRERCNLFIF